PWKPTTIICPAISSRVADATGTVRVARAARVTSRRDNGAPEAGIGMASMNTKRWRDNAPPCSGGEAIEPTRSDEGQWAKLSGRTTFRSTHHLTFRAGPNLGHRPIFSLPVLTVLDQIIDNRGIC